MKRVVLVLLMGAVCVSGFCGNKEDKVAGEEREKQEMKKQADKYRSYAEELKKQKVAPADEQVPERVKKATDQAAKVRNELAGILNSLADAYSGADKAKAAELQEQRWEKERELEIMDYCKKAASHVSSVEEMQKKYPESEDLKKLKDKVEANANTYIRLIEKQNELSRQRKAIDKDSGKIWDEMDAIKRKIKESVQEDKSGKEGKGDKESKTGKEGKSGKKMELKQ
jgi:hypothetical protein